MKKATIIFLAVLMLTSFASAADSALLKTTLLRYEPVPAEPGEYITVYIQIENTGTANANSVVIRMDENYPFSVDDEEELEKRIGTLTTNQAYVTDFKIRVDDKAVSGSNEIIFEVSDDWRNKDFTEKVFNINIQARDSELDIKDVTFDPANINPGKEGKINVDIKNDAGSAINTISLQLSLYDTQGSNLPFAIENGVSEKNINILGVGEEQTLTYDIISYPDATPGIYKIPVTLKYYDNAGTQYTKSDFITLIINPDSKIDLVIDDSSLSSEMRTGEISVRVINRGLGDIKFANLQIGEDESFDLISSYKSVYLGNIDSDDYDTADFVIRASGDDLMIPLSLEYKDSLNNERTLEKSLDLKIYPTNGGSSGSPIMTFLILAVIVGGIAYWYFKRRKRNKKR